MMGILQKHPVASRMRLNRSLLMLPGLLWALGAQAQAEAPPRDAPPAGVPAEPASEAPAAEPPAAFEGAVGLILSHQPSYSGSPDMVTKPRPAFYLRWGRFMVTNASVFVTRRQDDVLRGVSADLVNTATLRVNAALRVEQGRNVSESPRLAGLDDIDPTIRLRLSATWRFAPEWRLGVAVGPDLLSNGGGLLADVGLGHDIHFGPRNVLTFSAGVTAADARHLQSYYGVTPAQSLRSGYPVYQPAAGLRDASAGVSWRSEINARWATYLGASTSRLLGPAKRSPLTFDAGSWAVSGGMAWRF